MLEQQNLPVLAKEVILLCSILFGLGGQEGLPASSRNEPPQARGMLSEEKATSDLDAL